MQTDTAEVRNPAPGSLAGTIVVMITHNWSRVSGKAQL